MTEAAVTAGTNQMPGERNNIFKQSCARAAATSPHAATSSPAPHEWPARHMIKPNMDATVAIHAN
jgi:hypothetical protein